MAGSKIIIFLLFGRKREDENLKFSCEWFRSTNQTKCTQIKRWPFLCFVYRKSNTNL